MEFCFIKNNIVENILVCNAEFAEMWAEKNSYDFYIERPKNVGIGHYYDDMSEKFYTDENSENEIIPFAE